MINIGNVILGALAFLIGLLVLYVIIRVCSLAVYRSKADVMAEIQQRQKGEWNGKCK